ncbi:MAG: thermonuclease family protein [Syntrophobacteraceae bacterium]|nr:thermonuclease family protein [Syntrophobacteraceae bacterium]
MMSRGKSNALVIVLVLFTLFWLLPSSCFAYMGRVENVDGGDLLTVSANGASRKVRLFGIACPLFGQPFHGKAMFMTKFLSLKRNVDITPVFTDNYGIENSLVRVEGSGAYLNDRLLGYGLAWVKPCESKSHLCVEWKKLEGVAQMNFIGLWAQPPAIAPWEWQKAQRMLILDRMKSTEKKK